MKRFTYCLFAFLLCSSTVFAQAKPESGLDKEKMSKLLQERLENDTIRMTPEGLRQLMIDSGLDQKEADAMTPQELVEMFRDNIAGMQIPGMPIPGMRMGPRFSEEDIKRLSAQIDGLLAGHKPAIVDVVSSTVAVFSNKSLVCFGTIVDPRGFILTKHSEIGDGPTSCRIDGKMHKAKLVSNWEDHDLALLHVDAKGLPAVQWSTQKQPPVGTFVTMPGIEDDNPIGIGLLSVSTRTLSNKNKGFLGVQVGQGEGGVLVNGVIDDLPAKKAGILASDLITKLNGKAVTEVDTFIQKVGAMKPKQKLKLDVKRGDDMLKFNIELAQRPDMPRAANSRFNRMNLMGGDISRVNSGFLSIFQHDIPIRPQEIGGPVVSLAGEVLGINIARAGRIKTFAIPSDVVLEVLAEVDYSKLLKGHKSEVAKIDKADSKKPAAGKPSDVAGIAKADSANKADEDTPGRKAQAGKKPGKASNTKADTGHSHDALAKELQDALQAISKARKALDEAEAAAKRAASALEKAHAK